ncbi:MAG TPA: hypothetical protein VFQ53_42035 [Kofleriaceae bacterium]|nr:hypothetical protein [Kofleriaceae bacterium]
MDTDQFQREVLELGVRPETLAPPSRVALADLIDRSHFRLREAAPVEFVNPIFEITARVEDPRFPKDLTRRM